MNIQANGIKYFYSQYSIIMLRFFLSGSIVILLAASCCEKYHDTNTPKAKEFIFNFQTDNEGWMGDFADYPNETNVENFYELEFSYSMLPNPLNNNEGALRQSGNNHSDDLFMFAKKKISGLEPNTNYKIDIEIEFATNVANGTIGVGGSPGESVFLKAGATTDEPLKVLDNSDNYYRMNLDKGNQGQDGENMKVIGNFANGTDLSVYQLKVLKTISPINTVSNSTGEIWIIVGTDSGFESTTTIFYNTIKVNIK